MSRGNSPSKQARRDARRLDRIAGTRCTLELNHACQTIDVWMVRPRELVAYLDRVPELMTLFGNDGQPVTVDCHVDALNQITILRTIERKNNAQPI